MNDVYYIVPIDQISKEMLDVMLQTSKETIRKSLNGVYGVLKTNGYNSVFDGYDSYTHKEILPIMHSPEWQEPINE